MANIDDLIQGALSSLPDKPNQSAKATDKKNYAQQLSEAMAAAMAQELRDRGLKEARPAPPGVLGSSGSERRMAGGIGAKKVDVTWATEESGLLFALSIKTINFADRATGNYQKNLTNRRGDMLFESVTLHRRFPYAVLGGFLFLDAGAANDATDRRESTFQNAHQRLEIFSGRDDPAGRDEQYERLYIVLIDYDESPRVTAYKVGDYANPVRFVDIFDEFLRLVVARNPDLYRIQDGVVKKQPG